jgi:hypothetical protein
MYDLVDPAIRRTPAVVQLSGRETRGYTYDYPIDQRRLQHTLDSLFSLVKFGGQSLSKIARGTLLKKSISPGFVARVEAGQNPQRPTKSVTDGLFLAHLLHDAASYMEILIQTLLR